MKDSILKILIKLDFIRPKEGSEMAEKHGTKGKLTTKDYLVIFGIIFVFIFILQFFI